jgi:hypothetical protein
MQFDMVVKSTGYAELLFFGMHENWELNIKGEFSVTEGLSKVLIHSSASNNTGNLTILAG